MIAYTVFRAQKNLQRILSGDPSSRAVPAAQGYKDSNLEMTESESVALPFGDSPICNIAVADLK